MRFGGRLGPGTDILIGHDDWRLLVVTFWLWRLGKAWWMAGVPRVIVPLVLAVALFSWVGVFLSRGQCVLAALGAGAMVVEFRTFFEGFAAWR